MSETRLIRTPKRRLNRLAKRRAALKRSDKAASRLRGIVRRRLPGRYRPLAPVAHADVTVRASHGTHRILGRGKTDRRGNFCIRDLAINGSKRVLLVARAGKGTATWIGSLHPGKTSHVRLYLAHVR